LCSRSDVSRWIWRAARAVGIVAVEMGIQFLHG
jgi:hypothetical protein